MMKKLAILLLLLAVMVFNVCWAVEQETTHAPIVEFSVTNGDAALMKWLMDNEYLSDFHQQPQSLHFTGDAAARAHLASHGYTFEEYTVDVDRYLSGYQPYGVIADSIFALAAMYPDITQLIDYGPTTCHTYYLNGNVDYEDLQFNVYCLKLSDNPDAEEDEPNVYFAGGIHARETISVEVTMHVLTWLLENYGIDSDATNWIDNNQIWVIPVINPDGYEVAVQEWHAYHRKNMRDNDGDGAPDFSTTDGVDLNRNFGYVWGPNGTSSNPSNSLYNGPFAWSEIETVYMREMIQARRFWGGITYHSYGEWVIYPLGHIDGACSLDHEIMNELAVDMAATIPQIDGTGHYTPVQASDFSYTCQGTMGDWSYSEERVFGFTIELNHFSFGGYYPPPPYIDQIKADNLEAALMFLDRINRQTLVGHITDETGAPVEAEVWVMGIDDQLGLSPVEPYQCDANTGRYERPLLPGTYQVTFKALGYFDCVFDNVTIDVNNNTVVNPVLYGETVLSCLISAENNQVELSWNDPDGFDYSVTSCETPDGDFEVDESGQFTRDNVWTAPLIEPRRFYRVHRAAR